MSATNGTQMELLYSLPVAITKNTYTTQAAFSGVAGTNPICSLAAGWLMNDNPNPVGRALWLKATGTIATTSAATFAVALGFNATVATATNAVTVMAATAPVAAVTAQFTLDAFYTCTAFATSTATWQVDGTWEMLGAGNGGAAVATGLKTGFTGSYSAAGSNDPRVTNYIELFGTWSVSAAGNTTTLKQMFLWGMN
jgi:hypothetical protein